MKITTDEGEFELVPRYDDVYKEDIYVLKPIEPKSEKKEYIIDLFSRHGHHPVHEKLDLTEPTAKKLSEAISALVEYVTSENWNRNKLGDLALEARKSYRESQL